MSKKLATIISYIFHPGIMPTALLATLYFLTPYIVGIDGYTVQSKLLILSFIMAYTFLFPGLLVLWLYKRKKIQSMHLRNLRDRKLPYFFSILSSGFLAYFFFQKGAQLEASGIIIGFISLTILCIALISFKWQISAHGAGIGGVLGAFLMLKVRFDESILSTPFLIVLLISGLVLSARLKLNAHSSSQVTAGFTLGFIISLVGSTFL